MLLLKTIGRGPGSIMKRNRDSIKQFCITLAILVPLAADAEVIFTEDFDQLDDFTSTMHTTEKAQSVSKGHILPEGWYGLYQGTQWSPETGYPNNHASLEILMENKDKAFGGQGKSAVHWRESFSLGWKNWASDSQLVKLFDKEYEELHVKFDIKFSPNWWQRENFANYTSKIFRVGSWSREGDIFSGFQGALGPIYLWDYKRDAYGVRNIYTIRCGPHGLNYNCQNEYSGGSFNYTTHTKGQDIGGTDPQLENLGGSGYLVDFGGSTTHDQIFGPSEKWTQVEFYVRMNSEPGVADGVLRQWINGERVLNREDVPWVQENPENKMVGWNYIAIGGNDYFQPHPNEQQFEDWYAIDNLMVRSDMPDEGLDSSSSTPDGKMKAPNPPNNISVE